MKEFKEKITPHLKELIDNKSESVKKQFVCDEVNYDGEFDFTLDDPLGEEKFVPVNGLVHKYANRVLWKLSHECAAHCRFCTRRRQVGDMAGELTNLDIDKCIEYIKQNDQIEEIIISGGDPFFSPRKLNYVLERVSEINSVKVMRVGTRLPIHYPQFFANKEVKESLDYLERLAKNMPIFVLIHINHPDELTDLSRQVIKDIKNRNITVMSQTVFLKNINDNVKTLGKLFKEMYFLGIIPYYIFRCDYVRGLEPFVCDIKKEQKIMTELTKELSGISIPKHVIDVSGKGKIPVPVDFWDNIDLSRCRDFEGEEILL